MKIIKETLYENALSLVYKLNDTQIESLLNALHQDLGREATLYCEDGMAIAENYAKYEREIAELKKQIAELERKMLKQTILSLNLKIKEQNVTNQRS